MPSRMPLKDGIAAPMAPEESTHPANVTATAAALSHVMRSRNTHTESTATIAGAVYIMIAATPMAHSCMALK